MMTIQRGVAREFSDLAGINALRLALRWYSGKKITRRKLVCSIMECVSLSPSPDALIASVSQLVRFSYQLVDRNARERVMTSS